MRRVFFVIFCIFFIVWGGMRVVCSVVFDIECLGHLKRAADANTITLAREELSIAVAFLEKNGMTSGYTSVLYQTPDEDVGFWYKNLTAALAELESISPDTTQLEKTNVLMKLRETLLDAGPRGKTEITAPSGISIFPANKWYAILGSTSLLLVVITWLLIMREESY